MTPRRICLFCSAASALVVACSSVTETGNPVTARATIDPEKGGTLTLGAAKVEFGPGDLLSETPVDLTMTRTDQVAPGSHKSFSSVYRFGPSMVFRNPVKVCLPADNAPADAAIHWSRAPSPSSVAHGADRLFYDPVATVVSGKVACGETTHFSETFVGRAHQLIPWSDRDKPKVDILFVVDDSTSIFGWRETLRGSFPRFVEALRTSALGADGSGRPCTEADSSGCRIPDLHIGVVSPNLGAGPHSDLVRGGCENSLDGYLQNVASEPGCPQPSDAWISYAFDEDSNVGTTNVASGNDDPIVRVEEAFSCIATPDVLGCGYEQPLEAARIALDPELNRNPGFMREDALLVIVILTDEDDCSVANYDLLDPRNSSLGPAVFRCFEYGVECDDIVPGENSRQAGARTGCRPGQNWLKPVVDTDDSYEAFFKRLKPSSSVMISVFAGPISPVAVGQVEASGRQITRLEPSCTRSATDLMKDYAFPAIRLRALVDAFDSGSGDVAGFFTPICALEFGSTLEALGDTIASPLNSP